VIDPNAPVSNSTFTWTMLAIYIPFIAFMVWVPFGKHIRRWWRRRKLIIPNEENGVKTISGPTWDITWVKVSEAIEKRPEEQRSTVLGNTLAEVMLVLKARYGDEFSEQNVRSASKQSYSNVIVGIPERDSQ
jgi:hypothetical protein